MNQNKPLKNGSCSSAGTKQNAVFEQIQAAKANQKADARRRAELAAVQSTQSEVTQKPPTLYQPPKINVPGSFAEVARLIDAELSKISISQSFILTLWEQYQESQIQIAKLQQQVGMLQKRDG